MEGDKKTLLRYRGDYIDWHREFIHAAKDQDIWDLLNGDFKPVLVEPNLRDAVYHLENETDSSWQDISLSNVGRAVQVSASEEVTHTPAIIAVTKFKYDYKKYEKSQEKIKKARALIEATVSPIAASFIRDTEDPVKAYNTLKDKYKSTKPEVKDKLIHRLANTHLPESEYDIESYLTKLFQIRFDLKDHGVEMTDLKFVEYVVSGLNSSFAPGVVSLGS